NAGIVVVASAGNYGKNADGTPVYGGILAPANVPDVITVGAAKSQGTNRRSDDVVASFSSRGPTLVDGVVKPDLVAPGERLVSAASDGNSIVTTYPSLSVLSRGSPGTNGARDIYM